MAPDEPPVLITLRQHLMFQTEKKEDTAERVSSFSDLRPGILCIIIRVNLIPRTAVQLADCFTVKFHEGYGHVGERPEISDSERKYTQKRLIPIKLSEI